MICMDIHNVMYSHILTNNYETMQQSYCPTIIIALGIQCNRHRHYNFGDGDKEQIKVTMHHDVAA